MPEPGAGSVRSRGDSPRRIVYTDPITEDRSVNRLILTAAFALLLAGSAAAQPPRKLGSTPVPTEADLAGMRRFVEGVIDPKYTLDLIVGRPRLILLKEVPTRTQIADTGVATFRFLSPVERPGVKEVPGKQLTVVGVQPG